jgi:hypothetical protein
MFYSDELIPQVVYYLHFNTYFQHICNCKHQWRWHNNILETRRYFLTDEFMYYSSDAHISPDIHKNICNKINIHQMNYSYFSPQSLGASFTQHTNYTDTIFADTITWWKSSRYRVSFAYSDKFYICRLNFNTNDYQMSLKITPTALEIIAQYYDHVILYDDCVRRIPYSLQIYIEPQNNYTSFDMIYNCTDFDITTNKITDDKKTVIYENLAPFNANVLYYKHFPLR